MRNKHGFSLLEMIVVLAVVALLAGIAVLNHQALRSRLNLGMAARQVMMDLKQARMGAVTERVNHRIVFAAGGASYRRQRKTTSGYTDEGGPTALPPGIVIADCTAPSDAISFVPRGNAGSFGTVTVRNDRGEVRSVTVNIAGQVRVQ
jgi:prepilin-type N-terminal cleavage/methylation domain-containing protein